MAMPMSHLLCARKPARTESAELPTTTAPTTVPGPTSSRPSCWAKTGVTTYIVPPPSPPSSTKRTSDRPLSTRVVFTEAASWSSESTGMSPEESVTRFSARPARRFADPSEGGVRR